MYAKTGKNAWSWFLIILVGIVIGGFIGQHLKDISYLSWLSEGQTFGISDPFLLNLGILKLRFGLLLEINISGVLGVILAVFLYRRA